jgi:hypothetical protein
LAFLRERGKPYLNEIPLLMNKHRAPMTTTSQQQQYPLRMSRSFWHIPLHAVHACSALACSQTRYYTAAWCDGVQTYEACDEPSADYQNGRCSKSGLLFASGVSLHLLDIARPRAQFGFGDVYNPDRIVIPDLLFFIQIDFPLLTPTRRMITTTHALTLRETLHLVRLAYEDIYETELRTATHHTHDLVTACECAIRPVDITPPDTLPDASDMCSICYAAYTNPSEIGKCPCAHMFHSQCLQSWLNTGAKTCPLCRAALKQCDACDGTETVHFELTAPMLPVELRPYPFLRPLTDGVYGLHSYDFDQLVLRSMVYNRDVRTLFLCMSR